MNGEYFGSDSIALQATLDGLAVRLCSFYPRHREQTDEKHFYRHSHRAFEVHYVTHGRFTLTSGDESRQMYAGMFAMVPPGRFHASKQRSPDLRDRTISFELLPERMAAGGDGDFALRALHGAGILTGEGEDVIGPLRTLMAELTERPPGYMSCARAALVQIVLALARRVTHSTHTQGEQPANDLNFRRVFIIDNFFSDNFNMPDGDVALASLLGVSRRQLDRILKSLYGSSYRHKLMETRLQIAHELLCDTGYSVSDIAEKLGYGSPANFTSFIKKHTGMTPTQLRMINKQNNL